MTNKTKDAGCATADERIVTCINACAGLDPDALPEFIEAVELLLEADTLAEEDACVIRLRHCLKAVKA